jgi:hypothetical protein
MTQGAGGVPYALGSAEPVVLKGGGMERLVPSWLVPLLAALALGAVFNHYPRDTTLTWAPVADASSYWVEVEYCHSR